MIISLIAALDENNGIGAKNQLLWHLPDDFKWFKKHTMGKPVLMGRNTMLSLGRALPNRQNIVLSSRNEDLLPGFEYAKNIDSAIELLPEGIEELMVIGGGVLYNNMISKADKLIITRVHHSFEGVDTYFPKWLAEEWKETYREYHPADEKHLYTFDFLIYERV